MARTRNTPKLTLEGNIAFQGDPGAYSDIACGQAYKGLKTLPCPTFEDAFLAVSSGKAALAMIPIENTIAGRVADVHHLMQGSDLNIIGEHFLRIRHCLVGVRGAKIANLTHVHSHVMALPQCRQNLRALELKEVVNGDTAGACIEVAAKGDKTQAAIASELAAKIHGLEILKHDMQDRDDNVTRFVVLSKKPYAAKIPSGKAITSFIFEVKNIPAALYKALGGFATNQVNITKLESYVEGLLNAAEFYCEVEGHPDDVGMKRAFEELEFFTKSVRMLGTYPAHAFRRKDLRALKK